jgi:hypothetical protein
LSRNSRWLGLLLEDLIFSTKGPKYQINDIESNTQTINGKIKTPKQVVKAIKEEKRSLGFDQVS